MADVETEMWRIRILNGPLRGVTHRIRKRVSIGRASSSDIQLVHDGISRQHAQIVTEGGRHLLQDLDSSNGTFVDGERIHRHPLTPGTAFKIMKVKLVYEPDTDASIDSEDSGVFAVVNGSTLRGTVDYSELDLPQPASARVHADTDAGASAESGEQEREPEAPLPRKRTQDESSTGPAVQARAEERHRVVAKRADGSHYEGSLVDDVVLYRELRSLRRRGDELSSTEQGRYEQLDDTLRVPATDDGGEREFCRFETKFPARLRFSDGAEQAAAVLDMGVDGAKLRVYGHRIEHDSIIWLAIHLVSRGRALTVVFTCRVAWTTKDHVGLSFAGAPGWEHQGHRKVAVRTHMDLRDQVRAARSTLARIKLRRRPMTDS